MTTPGPIPGLGNLAKTNLDEVINLPVLDRALTSTNPVAASYAANQAAQLAAMPTRDISIIFYDKTYDQAGVCTNYKSLEYTFNRNKVGTATIVLDQLDANIPIVMNCWQTVVPVTIQSGYLRWSGRVEYVDYSYKDDKYDITVYCTDDYQWFDKILCWPDFLLPVQVQFPARAIYIGPAISCVKTMISEQTFRLQLDIYELINDALSLDLSWEAWFATLLESNGNLSEMVMTPIVVVSEPDFSLFDTSPWTSINGRMDKISTLVADVLKDNGLVLTANLWLPGDPQPKGLAIPLTVATIVVDCRDMSGVTGPSGTFIDGLIKDVVDLQSSVLGNVLAPLLNPTNQYAPEGVNIAPVLGVNFVPPWALFSDHPRGGLREYHVIPHSPLATSIIGGGKSPAWVNDLINATLEWGIDAIEILVGITAVPDTLLDGTFDDIILAFQQLENAPRRISLGPYAFREYFQQTGSGAYTLDEWFSLLGAMWDTRGYHGIIVEFDDGFPYTVGKDIFVGSLASFVATNLGVTGSADAGQGFLFQELQQTASSNLYTDYVERITIKDTPEVRRRVSCMIGDGKSHEDPVVRLQRVITKFQEFYQTVTLSS